jgi:hypothetical protein
LEAEELKVMMGQILFFHQLHLMAEALEEMIQEIQEDLEDLVVELEAHPQVREALEILPQQHLHKVQVVEMVLLQQVMEAEQAVVAVVF